MNKKGQQSSSCNQTPNSKMVEATHLQSMKSSRACQLLWLQYPARHRQDAVMNLVFPPYKCDTFPGKKKIEKWGLYLSRGEQEEKHQELNKN